LKIVNALNSVTEGLLATGSALAATKYLMTLQGLDILPLAREPYAPLTEEAKVQLKKVYENAFNN
jgi:dihydrodipicolinate synthase/N-acetylneuraminate lyase